MQVKRNQNDRAREKHVALTSKNKSNPFFINKLKKQTINNPTTFAFLSRIIRRFPANIPIPATGNQCSAQG